MSKKSKQSFKPEIRIFSAGQLKPLISICLQKNLVMAPQMRRDQPGFYHFDWLDAPENAIVDYTTTTIPPKKAFFPAKDPVLRFNVKKEPILEILEKETPFTLFGIHPCDLAAIRLLDAAYSNPPADTRWESNRRRCTIIGVDCMPDPYCFCISMGTCNSREPCDLFLTGIGRGYLAEIHTPEGKAILDGIVTEKAHEKDLLEARIFRDKKASATSARLFAETDKLADLLEARDFTDFWKQIASRCYSCGSCNITCPTCFCFDMHDTLDSDLKSGRRYRTWDSCQLLDFARVAGHVNMRAARWQRVRHRWHRKFLYLNREFGNTYCTGCGRCSRACTADINIVDVSNELIKKGLQERIND